MTTFEAKYYDPDHDLDEVMLIEIDECMVGDTSDCGLWRAAVEKFFNETEGHDDLIEMKMISM